MKFAFENNDMDFAKAKVPYSDVFLEVIKTDEDEYSIYALEGDTVTDIATLTKSELKTLWKMLTDK